MAKKKKFNKKPLIKPQGPLEWLYFADDDASLRSIYERLKKEEQFEVEFWEEAGVLEVSVEEGGNLDMERSEEEHVYWVNVSSKGYEAVMNAMKIIEQSCGGQFQVDGGE